MVQTVSSGGIVVNSEGKVLLVDQGGVWSLPKGHVKDGEGLMDTAKREISEEAGIKDLQYVMNLGNYKRGALDNPQEIKNIFMFLFKTIEAVLKPNNGEIKEARWVSREEALNLLTHPQDKEFFTKVNPILEV